MTELDTELAQCKCSIRTCGPHRCWPSRAGWIFFGITLWYTIFMHSTFTITANRMVDRAMKEKDELVKEWSGWMSDRKLEWQVYTKTYRKDSSGEGSADARP